MQFVAVKNPPKSTLGLMSLEGTPLRNGDTTTAHLVKATYVDGSGNPLPGEIKWEVGSWGQGGSDLLSAQTQTLGDGTTTNGVRLTYPTNSQIDIVAIAPDGVRAEYLAAAYSYAPAPSITIDSDAGQLTATYPGVPDGTDVLWEAFPADQVQFAQQTTKIENGSTQNTIANASDAAVTAYISASSFNAKEGARDYGTLQLALAPNVITITTQDGTPRWWLYEPRTLNATYDGTDPVNELVWSTGPEQAGTSGHTFTFSRNPTPLVDGKASNNITGFGPNLDTGGDAFVTVYARSADPGHSVAPGQKSLDFMGNGAGPPATKLINVVSLDGDPLATGQIHVIQATYIAADGKPVQNAQLTWKASDQSVTFSAPPGQATNANGVMTNVIQTTRPDPFDFTVTVSADGTSDTSDLNLTFPLKVDLPKTGTMTLTSQDGDTLTVGDKHEVSVKYLGADGNPMPDGTAVTWAAFPSDRVSFVDGNSTQTSGGNGIATNHVIASQGDGFADAMIAAASLNPNNGGNDHGQYGPITFEQVQPDTIVVTGAGDTAPLYAPYTLTAQHTGTKETVTEVVWSVDQGHDATHTFTFDPPRSPLTGDQGTTQITGLGANADVTVTVYARPDPADAKVQLVPKKLTFKAQGSVPASASLAVVSLDGDPLQDGSVYHLFKAAYTNMDGTKATTAGWDGTISWGPAGDPNLTWLETDPTPTDERGIATNALMRQSPGDVTVTVQATGTSDTANLSVTFADTTQQPGQGTMTITSGDPSPLSLGEQHPFTVQYLDGDTPMPNNTPVYWYGFPADRLIFGTPNPTLITGGQGYAKNTVMALGTTDIDDAYIWTSSFNPAIGANDEGHYGPIAFKRPAGLTGIEIDKAYAHSPPRGSPADPTESDEVVKCRVQVVEATGPQEVSLPTDPAISGVTMFDARHSQSVGFDAATNI